MGRRKRAFSKLDDSSNVHDLPQNKRRKVVQSEWLKTMFSNKDDHVQYIAYLHSIEATDLTQKMSIPLEINREIAEYATGSIKDCGNKDCENQICVLNETFAHFANGKKVEWNYCTTKHVYFCELCKPSTIEFICCGTVQFVNEKKKCYFLDSWNIDGVKCANNNRTDFNMGYKCDYCDVSGDGNCDDCGAWMCEMDREDSEGGYCYNETHRSCCTLLGPCGICRDLVCNACGDCAKMCKLCCRAICQECAMKVEEFQNGDGFVCSISSAIGNPNATEPSTTSQYTLCLELNKVELNGPEWPTRMKFSKTEGIFYVYNDKEALDTFKSLSFPISESWPTSFTFDDDESSVGCWTNPDFTKLSIRFKVYQFYHTAMKAVSIIQISDKSRSKTTYNLTLNTLPYQYDNVNVSVECTLKWTQQPIEENDLLPMIYSKFDSDEITDEMMTNHEAIAVDKESTNWMFIAALCSSMLGAFVLLYICISAYKGYLRKEYESIPNAHSKSSVDGKLGSIRRISLRNIGYDKIAKDEEKNIMHPAASYTF